MPLSKLKVRSGLKKKGFIEDNQKNHVYFSYKTISGKVTSINTKISHGGKYKDVSDSLLSIMAQQCKLSTSNFKRLINCPLKIEDYDKIVSDLFSL